MSELQCTLKQERCFNQAEESKIKRLPDRFRKKNVNYEIVKRIGDLAILSLHYCENGEITGFDVVRVLRYVSKSFPWKNGNTSKQYEEIETIPHSELWGFCAWSFDKLETAEEFFNTKIAEY